MKLVPDIAWRSADAAVALDPRLLRLLREIREQNTLRAAVVPLGMSYRAAWDLLGAQSRLLGTPLVKMVRGRGARLAPLAEQLVAADAAARQQLEAAGDALGVSVAAGTPATAARPRVAASHDLLLAEFGGALLDLEFRGSLQSLRAYSHGDADIAGFHLSGDPAESGAYRALLQPRRDRLIRFAARDQGLLLAPGNPKGVRELADVARKHLRFVNRQRGSGTRQLVDRLLREARVQPAQIKGYADEEFTHLAVAATIASGRADAGVGVRAAAARFNLAFVPLGRERYWLVVRQRDLGQARMQRLLKALRDGALKRIARRLTGYDVHGAGDVLPLAALSQEAG